MTNATRSPGAFARPDRPAATEPEPHDGLVPLVRLLARQAAREYLLTHPADNDNNPAIPA